MSELTKKGINDAIATTWMKLERAVQQELDRVLAGEAELTASTTTAVVKFIEASKDISLDYINLDEAMTATIDKITGGKPETFALPTFDDEGEQTNLIATANTKTKNNKKKVK